MVLTKMKHPYLVGIKGVAQTALAQCLSDMGKVVRGCDVSEKFVTQAVLEQEKYLIDTGFELNLPAETDGVIYTSAHNAQQNPVVQAAINKGLPVLSHAEALAELFNFKAGIAVCGVGGKSTTSALLSWIFSQTNHNASFAIGVGDIIGLGQTGFWSKDSQYFVAEADEYVTDPTAPSRGEKITPRFSYLQPQIIICTNLAFDHPDVYTDFAHTQEVFLAFFQNLKPAGTLIYNADDLPLAQLVAKFQLLRPDVVTLSFGESKTASLRLIPNSCQTPHCTAQAHFKELTFSLETTLPGSFNLFNAAAAYLAASLTNLPQPEILAAIKSFRSTLRRSEYKGMLNQAVCYDDYAHHPSEIQHVLTALRAWHPDRKLIVAFQPHTFSRTKALLSEFASALTNCDRLLLLPIFASAREKDNGEISSEALHQAVQSKKPDLASQTVTSQLELASALEEAAQEPTVLLTIGAGDIYEVYDRLQINHD